MQTAVLKIDGMNSDACADKVAQILNHSNGVSEVRVSLLNSQADVQFDESHTNTEQLAGNLARAGYQVQSGKPAEKNGGCCGGCCG
ncbi:heavy-metal-associated domain-containing protein [Rugamonas sp. CCM 8940]|uniref:heavy-metal-associated domain-containing protein n=1 Tax=Rugamonas sp. CCM 8940 TaxID=2765359 RepID=UPI0018F2F41E|nr:heavy-metal-associated domain-containing protein [Rugamonas sp. CCM 8940]MBJ7311192.1 heavy-metal-associated domain-containing protein [Rugamonas sp. CCM 8940]